MSEVPALSPEPEDVLRALRESEERFRAFMDHSPALAWMKDEDGRYVYVSGRLEERYLTTFANWRGKTDFDLWPEETARQLRDNDLSVLTSGRPVTAVEAVAGPTGAMRYWWVIKFPFTDGAGRRFVGGMSVEITDRERMAEELRQANAELQAALEKIRQLKSLVTMCAWTGKLRLGDRWVSVEEFLRDRLGVRVSHGMSDEAFLRLEEEVRQLSGEEPGPRA